MTLSDGIELPLGKVAEVCRKYHVRQMRVFGSAARREATPNSDIDVLTPEGSLR